jgi:YHS domain-containing protein
MVQRTAALAAMLAGVLGLTAAGVGQPTGKAKAEDAAKVKKALQELQEFVGPWNLEGTQKVGARTEAWKEKLSWGWKFKGDDAWLSFESDKGKYYTKGDLRYLPEKKKYQLSLSPAGKSEAEVYEGEIAKGALRLERKDAKTGDVYRLTMNTAADGIRMVVKFEKQEGGKGLFASVYQLAGNKEGESLGATAKKPECIVTGGAATIKVSYQGKEYFVCCSGCRDAFNETPEKFIKAAKK